MTIYAELVGGPRHGERVALAALPFNVVLCRPCRPMEDWRTESLAVGPSFDIGTYDTRPGESQLVWRDEIGDVHRYVRAWWSDPTLMPFRSARAVTSWEEE